MYPVIAQLRSRTNQQSHADESGSRGVRFCRVSRHTRARRVALHSCLNAMSDRLKVAFVAPSLRILGGQAVQADRLLSAWRDDPDVDAWLVPVNPEPPRAAPLRAPDQIRPHDRQRADLPAAPGSRARARGRRPRLLGLVHVVPARAAAGDADRAGAGQARRPELPERRGAGPSAAVGDRARGRSAASTRTSSRRASWSTSSAASASTPASCPNIVDLERFRFRERNPLRPRLVSTRNFDALYNVATTIRAFKIVQDRWPDASLTLVGGGRQEADLRALVARARAAPRDVRRPGRTRTPSPATTPTTTSTSRARTSTTCRRRCSRRSRAACRSCRRRRAAYRRS